VTKETPRRLALAGQGLLSALATIGAGSTMAPLVTGGELTITDRMFAALGCVFLILAMASRFLDKAEAFKRAGKDA
jgi:hypothetical protein